MGWRPISSMSNNPILKFGKDFSKGAVIEGVFMGLRTLNPQYGPLADIRTEAGVVTVAAPTVLRNALGTVPSGTRVRIEYGGKDKNKKGQDVHLFEVSVPDDAPVNAPASAPGQTASAPEAGITQAAYDALAAKFKSVVGAPADATLSALSTLYSDVATRFSKLTTIAASKGVAA